jgi:hypothetical protein
LDRLGQFARKLAVNFGSTIANKNMNVNQIDSVHLDRLSAPDRVFGTSKNEADRAAAEPPWLRALHLYSKVIALP